MKASQSFKKSTWLTIVMFLISGGALLLSGCQKSLDDSGQSQQANATVRNNADHPANVPFKADFVTTYEAVQSPAPGIPLIHHLSGIGTGSHIGQAAFDAYVTIDVFGLHPNSGTAVFTIKAANGDRIFMDVIGTIAGPDENGVITVTVTATITGGTGRFIEVSGTLTGSVIGSVTGNTDVVSLNGTISY